MPSITKIGFSSKPRTYSVGQLNAQKFKSKNLKNESRNFLIKVGKAPSSSMKNLKAAVRKENNYSNLDYNPINGAKPIRPATVGQ